MNVIPIQNGYQFEQDGKIQLRLEWSKQPEGALVTAAGSILDPFVEEITSFLESRISEYEDVEMDLSNVAYMCPAAVDMLVEINVWANDQNRRFHIERVSQAASGAIHDTKFVSQLLSGLLETVESKHFEPVDVLLKHSDSEKSTQEQHVQQKHVQECSAKDTPEKTRLLNSERRRGLPATQLLSKPQIPLVVHLSTGKVYTGQKFKTTLGRAAHCDVCLEGCEYVSIIHAHIMCSEGKCFIAAEPATTNITLANGSEVVHGKPVEFQNEVWLQLANELFYVCIGKTTEVVGSIETFAWLRCCSTNEPHLLLEEPFLLGRENPWPMGSMNNEHISRNHANISFSDGVHYITDLHSANTTCLNGTQLEPDKAYALANGDKIILGDERLVYQKKSMQKRRGETR